MNEKSLCGNCVVSCIRFPLKLAFSATVFLVPDLLSMQLATRNSNPPTMEGLTSLRRQQFVSTQTLLDRYFAHVPIKL